MAKQQQDLTPEQAAELRLVQQIDELERISKDAREKFFGQSWFRDVRKDYTLDDQTAAGPSFRPTVRIPQLQVLSLNEVTDLTDADPKIYICGQDGQRMKAHEKALMAEWRQQFVNNRIMEASLWAQMGGLGFIQLGFDPQARGGRGKVWFQSRTPDTVYHDPSSWRPEEWQWLIMHDDLYIEQVKQRWPDRGYDVRPKAVTVKKTVESGGMGFQMPEGPMSTMGGLPSERILSGDGKLRVRYIFVRDPQVEDIPEADRVAMMTRAQEKNIQGFIPPKRRPKYPNARYIVECEGVILVDGDNPFPMRRFPLIPFLGMPVMSGAYGPPPARYTRSLQQLAERMYAQVYENAVRLNNGVTYVPENTGITLDNFGGMPAEVHIINSNSQPPVTVWPQPLPQHMIQLPELLLQKQKELQGFTPARMGEPGAGNISDDLYQGSIWQSKTMTRMRGRLMTESVQSLAELAFYTMAKYYRRGQFPEFPANTKDDFNVVSWADISGKYDEYSVYLDPGSISPLSQAAQRMMMPQLRELGLLPTGRALEMAGVSDPEGAAKEIEMEQKLAALANVQKKR